MSNTKDLVKALRQVGANPYQVKMAAILLAVNGIDNALEFVFGLQARGLTLVRDLER
jgi:hypothetical protein